MFSHVQLYIVRQPLKLPWRTHFTVCLPSLHLTYPMRADAFATGGGTQSTLPTQHGRHC